MNIAVVGCGYVAEFYAKTLGNYPSLRFAGACDQNSRNLDAFTRRWGGRAYRSLTDVTDDAGVDMVLNLTNPRSHFAVTKQCLESGKHVYSEKPLGMTVAEATALVDIAARADLRLASAPCSVLSETAQTVWKALRDGAIGKVRLVYANFDDGMIAPRMAPWTWSNESGIPWPARDEFEVGCTYEHAGYVLSWLAAFFGPALAVTSFASCLIPDKGIEVGRMAPDFTVGCLEYADGIVARVTCGLVAPRDKSITIVGDDGVLFVADVRNDVGPVMYRPAKAGRWQTAVARRLTRITGWLDARIPGVTETLLMQRRYSLVRRPTGRLVDKRKPVDFMRGPAEMAEAIRAHRACRLSAELGAHIVEIVEALQYPDRVGGRRAMTTTFVPPLPMEWAA